MRFPLYKAYKQFFHSGAMIIAKRKENAIEAKEKRLEVYFL